TSNTIWNFDTVKIVSDVLVDTNVTLTIKPGTFVEAQGYFKIEVMGKIVAIGNSVDSIVFSVNDTNRFWSDSLSTSGGWNGIFFIGVQGQQSSSEFKYCKFEFGKKYGLYGGNNSGGAVHSMNYHKLSFSHCLFINNRAICHTIGAKGAKGGAIYCQNNNEVVIDSCNFLRNNSFYTGGGINIEEGCSLVIISNNTFKFNKAKYYVVNSQMINQGGSGTAIYCADNVHSPDIFNNYCYNNVGVNGIIYSSNRKAKIYNNVICNNSGAGIFIGHTLSESKVFNNTIANNICFKGAISNTSRKVKLFNNIIWGNENNLGANNDQIYNLHTGSGNIIRNNCVEYGPVGDSSIFSNPEFINPTLGVGPQFNGSSANWELEDWSPCINSGTSDTNGVVIPKKDALGMNRVIGSKVDIGAFENQNIINSSIEVENNQIRFSMFPNPANSIVNIKLISENSETINQICIYDTKGQLVYQKNSPVGYSSQINISEWPTGLYFVKIGLENDIIKRLKLIVY
ncbi:MAG: T9SS type A sorting domain-containing protein, partial [Salibacteraceae bacterium]